MALSVIGGKKINSHSGGTGPKILKNSEKLSNQEIVVRPQSNNLFHHADVILCGLNVSLSSEKKEFSLFSEKDTNYTGEGADAEPKLIDGTDKFHGTEPEVASAHSNGRSEFYNLDDELTEAEKRLIPRKNSIKQVSFLVACSALTNISIQNSVMSKNSTRVENPYINSRIVQKPEGI